MFNLCKIPKEIKFIRKINCRKLKKFFRENLKRYKKNGITERLRRVKRIILSFLFYIGTMVCLVNLLLRKIPIVYAFVYVCFTADIFGM